MRTLYSLKPTILTDFRHNETETPGPDLRNAVDSVVKKSRKSLNKTIDRVTDALDPANIALPESPISV